MLSTLDVSASGLIAQRVRMDTIANNIANISTTRNASGENIPFRRKMALFAAGMAGERSADGVHVSKIIEDDAPFKIVHDPNHIDADENGNVRYPNVNITEEMVDAIAASRAYEANVTAMEATKSMMAASLRIIA